MKRLVALILVLVMGLSLVACNDAQKESKPQSTPEETPAETPEETPAETPEETPEETPAPDLSILDSPIELLAEGAKINVIIPADADRHVNYAADRFINGVRILTGAEIVKGEQTQEIELLIGNTGRSESNELKATLGEDEFAVKLMGKKLVVVATDDAFLYEAVGELLEFIKIEENADFAEGKITLKRSIDVKKAGDKTSYVYLFSKTDTLTAVGVEKFFCPLPSDEVQETQGGCIADGYYYQSFIKRDGGNEANNNVIVVKYDWKTGEKLAQSEVLRLNHSNDITYNKFTHQLYIVNHGPNTTTITLMDPDTLTVIGTKKLLSGVYSITFNPERNFCAVGLSGGQNLRLYPADLTYDKNLLRIAATNRTVTLTTQGIGSDENFIYCVLWDKVHFEGDIEKLQNVVTVYDWYGNFVGLINIDVTKLEPENASIIDGKLYISAHSNGTKVFEMQPTIG